MEVLVFERYGEVHVGANVAWVRLSKYVEAARDPSEKGSRWLSAKHARELIEHRFCIVLQRLGLVLDLDGFLSNHNAVLRHRFGVCRDSRPSIRDLGRVGGRLTQRL